MRLRRPFAGWSMESTIGLIAIITAIIVGAVVASLLGAMVWSLTQPAPQPPKQTVSQYVDRQGDVQRLCLVYKTGQHVDAVSCDPIDTWAGNGGDEQ